MTKQSEKHLNFFPGKGKICLEDYLGDKYIDTGSLCFSRNINWSEYAHKGLYRYAKYIILYYT